MSPPSESCQHCGSPIPEGAPFATFCCAGCEAVARLLKDEGLSRYYALAGSAVTPVAELPSERSLSWLDPILSAAESRGPVAQLELDIQGIHCAACVWLINELFRREPHGSSITVNPALGKVRLQWLSGKFAVGRFLKSVEKFGYRFGPSRKQAVRASSELPLRLGICAAITMNVMIFSLAFYMGLTPQDAEIFSLFTTLSALLSTAVVIIGGWPFFRSALRGVRTRVLHLDLPIALGIVLVYATSLLKLRDGRGDLAYFDTLNTFVTLMLVGRWLQQRVLERNRRFLLEDDGAEGLFARRLENSKLELVPVAKLEQDDLLVVAPGDLIPIDATLLDAEARISTDWVTGESAERAAKQNDPLPAGAFNAGRSAIRVRALTSFQQSPLVSLLRQTATDADSLKGPQRFWHVLAKVWVVSVLTLAALGTALWWNAGPEKALEVAVALLVVTCPCAIGIALPLAYELMQSRLRREGFFIRASDLLDRLPRVRTLIFDKTGTLTLGRLELTDRSQLDELPSEILNVLHELTARSNHPMSRCLAHASARRGAKFTGAGEVIEVTGCGLTLETERGLWRLGKRTWATQDANARSNETVLSLNAVPLAAFTFREAVRHDAKRELDHLRAEGLEVHLLSGDAPERVRAMGEQLGLSASHVRGALTPEQKADAVTKIDRADTLYLGDGVNDALAFQKALCAGTPAIDRPVMPSRSDFFLVGEGLKPLRTALEGAKTLRVVVHRVLALAVAYNVIAVLVCLSGAMTPLRAAVAMPASSLSILLFTAWSLTREGRNRATARTLQEAAA